MNTGRYWEAYETQQRTLRQMAAAKTPGLMQEVWKVDDQLINSLLTLVQGGLKLGATFYWTRETLEVVHAAAQSMPAWTFTPGTLPSQHGFCYFETPLRLTLTPDMTDINPEMTYLRAVSWTGFVRLSKHPTGDHIRDRQGTWVRTCREGEAPDQTVVTWYIVDPDRDRCPLVPVTQVPLEANQTLNDALSIYRTELESRNDYSADAHTVLGEKLRLFACMVSFLEQRILTHEPRKAPRHIRRQSTEIPEGKEIEVVYLRRVSAERPSGEPHHIDWHYRWLVSGHWRQQPYGPREAPTYKPLWIAPYVKGPEGKPVKTPPVRVFGVIR